jgi:hypothetical protein
MNNKEPVKCSSFSTIIARSRKRIVSVFRQYPLKVLFQLYTIFHLNWQFWFSWLGEMCADKGFGILCASGFERIG